MNVEQITSLPNWREPKIGEDICVPTALYLSHGHDDFLGGLCQIIKIEDRRKNGECTAADVNRLQVAVAERPGTSFNWYYLIEQEEKNLKQYGDKRGRPDPDDRPQFNTGW